MEAHAPIPDAQDPERIGQPLLHAVEERIAQTTAQHHAKGAIEQQIADIVTCQADALGALSS